MHLAHFKLFRESVVRRLIQPLGALRSLPSDDVVTWSQTAAASKIGAAERTGDTAFLRQVMGRMRPHLRKSAPLPTDCILRGKPTRKVECKPCNAGAGGLMVDVFSCPIHTQCTLTATGISPRIQSCAGCQDRLEKAYQIEATPAPPAVLVQIARRVAPFL